MILISILTLLSRKTKGSHSEENKTVKERSDAARASDAVRPLCLRDAEGYDADGEDGGL